MLYRDFHPFRRSLPLLLLALGVGASEAAFVFSARHGLARGGFGILPWLGALVLLRFFFQDFSASLEITAMRRTVLELRRRILDTLGARAVPVYRSGLKHFLIHALDEVSARAGEGLLAREHCQGAALQALVLFPCLFILSWRLALLSLLLAPPAWLVLRWRNRSLRALERGETAANAENREILEAFGEDLESVSGGAALLSAVASLDGELEKGFSPGWRWRLAQARYPAWLEAGFFFALAILMLAGGSFLGAWENWILFSGLLLLAYRPVREAARHYPTSLQGSQALRDLGNLLREWECFPPRSLPAPALDGSDALVLEAVDFGYAPGQKVLRDFSAEFGSAAITGITGPNGCGKTTLLRLLSGAEVPLQGRVFWPEALRRHGAVAYLPQRATPGRNWRKWAGSLKTENSALWKELNGILGLERLLKNTSVEGWSGGERQRMALARVLASDSPFLLLDEPTTALPGSEREETLAGALWFWRRSRHPNAPERGAVIVSHEPFLIRCCDAVFALDGNGKGAGMSRPRDAALF